ncbi:MAG: hypothetical protein J6331_05175 [Lentisphaeria bacterium]|nr:hypothetical protein [Lentisphaeria bacterium]
MEKDHQFLLSLLNDDSEQSAALAMSALLEGSDHDVLEEDLRFLQESPDKRLRKRVHQLQSTISLRRRRPAFSRILHGGVPEEEGSSGEALSLIDGLIRTHLLWFDNDSGETLKKQWEKFLSLSRKYSPDSLEEIAFYMRKKKFRCTHKDELEPENFCLGSVLADKLGADFMLCAIAVELFRHWNKDESYDIGITQAAEKDFILVDTFGNILVPANDWDYIPYEQQYRFEFWEDLALLRYASMMLFICAASTDSFRYVFTVGSCLSDHPEEPDPVAGLPYPYGKREERGL